MSFEKIQQIAKELKLHENTISNLNTLNMVKGRQFYVNRKYKGVQDFSMENTTYESVNIGICPYCTNQIDWDKINKLITKHKKAINLLNKELVEVSKIKENEKK